MEAHVGHHYGNRRRLVVVSLDSGASMELESRTAEIESITPERAGNAHMCGTAKLSRLLIDPFDPPERPMECAAMLNSAKCAGADGSMSTVPFAVHSQCREYLFGELQILSPDLIWLQGSTVRDVLSDRLTTPNLIPGLRYYLATRRTGNEQLEHHLEPVAREHVRLLQMCDGAEKRAVFSVMTPHPSDRYGRWGLFERAYMLLVAHLANAYLNSETHR
jgi:hypothetical protein